MSEIKSVRVRKFSESSNSGVFDLKVILNSATSSNAVRSVMAVTPTGQVYWPSVDFQGQRYENKSDDDVIDEFVLTNSETDANRIGSRFGSKLYRIIQDPWSDEIPQLRKFGEDPYYLNNGSYIMLKWKKYLSVSYEFDAYYIYGNGTSSSPTQVLVDTAMFFDGISPSDLDISYPNYFEIYYNAGSYSIDSALSHVQSKSQTTGFSMNSPEYDLNYPSFGHGNDYSFFPPVGTSSYTTEISGYEYSDSNLKETNTPNNIFKVFFIVPSGLTGSVDPSDDVERLWSFDDKYQPRFLLEISDKSKNLNPLIFDYNVTDESIVSKVIENWISYLSAASPSAKSYNLKLNNPSFVKPTENIISDFSPKNGYGMKDGKKVYPENTQFKFEPVGSDPNKIVTSGTGGSSSIASTTQSQFNKVPLNFEFPDNWIVKTDEGAPTFSIWIGDIEADIPAEGFIFSEEGDNMTGLSPEYIENQFGGEEESMMEINVSNESSVLAESPVSSSVSSSINPESSITSDVSIETQTPEKSEETPEQQIENMKKRFGKNAEEKKFSDGSKYLVVLYDNKKGSINFYNNGRFMNTNADGSYSKGNFYNNGRKLIVTEGKNADKTLETQNFWDTLKLLKK